MMKRMGKGLKRRVHESFHQHTRDREPKYRVYFTSGLAVNFILFTAVWVTAAGFWSLLLNFGYLDDLAHYSNAFVELSFLIGFVFNYFFNKSFKGYIDQPIAFKRLLKDVEALCRRTMTFLNCRRLYAFKMRDETTGTFMQDDETPETARRNMRMFEKMFCGLADCANELFLERTTVRDPLDLNEIMDFLVYTKTSHGCTDEKMIDLLTDIGIQITRLEDEGFIKESQHKLLFEQIVVIENTLTSIDISHTVNSPNLFNNHLGLILIVWFGVWFPFTLTIRLSYATLIIYPVIMDLLFGVNIIRKYMRSALDPHRPIKVNNFESWCTTTKKMIKKISCIDEKDFGTVGYYS